MRLRAEKSADPSPMLVFHAHNSCRARRGGAGHDTLGVLRDETLAESTMGSAFDCDDVSRRGVLAGAAGAAAIAVLPQAALAAETPIATRRIPVSGEDLPVIGLGTVGVFNIDKDDKRYAAITQVVQTMIAGGAKLIDTAASYGKAEERIGDVVSDLGARNKVFIATKFSSADAPDAQLAQVQQSLQRMKMPKIDLLQAWNVADPNYKLGALRDWKAQGICRYTGITSSFHDAFEALPPVIKREKPDFFQIDYSLADREAEKVLLPTAKDSGAAVLINLPFGGGRNSLFKKVGDRPLPDFAAEIDAKSWGQFFLKFILSHPAVNAAMPGTNDPAHMIDNLAAGRGRMPDAAMRKKMADYWDSLA
jgi:aryl-alcohol dehydrogenase-like predicted oxidoreductase